MIGRFYNGRDHSTVIHSIQRIEALRESDPDLDALLSELKDQLTRRQDRSDETKVFEAPTKVPYASYITSTNLLRL